MMHMRKPGGVSGATRCTGATVMSGRPRTRRHAPPDPAPCPTGGQARRRARREARMTPDQVSGLFDAGEAFVEGTIAAALVVLWYLRSPCTSGVLHGPHDRQVHPPARSRPVVDHLRRASATSSSSRCSSAASSSSTRMSSPGRVADHRGACRRVRLRGPAHQAGSAWRRDDGVPPGGPPARAWRDAVHRPVPPRRRR